MVPVVVAPRAHAQLRRAVERWEREHPGSGRSYDRRWRCGLPVVNPATRLQQAALKPRETRIPDAGFADCYAKVVKLQDPVRRDLQLVALFTRIRSDGVRNLRWG